MAVPTVLDSQDRRTTLSVEIPKNQTVGLVGDRTVDYVITVQGSFRLEKVDKRTFTATYDEAAGQYWTSTIFRLVRRKDQKVFAEAQVCLEEELVGNRCPPPAPAEPPDPEEPLPPVEPPPDPEEPPPNPDPDFPPEVPPDPPDPDPPVDPPAEPSEPVLNTVLELLREEDEIISEVVHPVPPGEPIPDPPPPPEPELPPDPPPEPEPPSQEFHRTVSGTFAENLIIPEGQKWRLQDVTMIRAHILVDGTLAMRPGDSIRMQGGIPGEYAGGGMTYGPGMEQDFGIWIRHHGDTDIRGTPKLGWNRTGTHSTWATSDEKWISPTARGDFTPRRWFDGDPVPQMESRVPPAEVINVTRDVNISGVGHFHIHSHHPQRIEYARIDGFGIAHSKFYIPDVTDDPTLNGRYALHAHMMEDGSQGSVFRGIALTNTRGKGYVPHTSHGIQFIDCVSVNGYSAQFWWDEGFATNDILVDRMCISGVELPWEILGFNRSTKPGIELGEGVNMTIRNSAVSGIRGWEGYANGIGWVQPLERTPREWVFVEGNVVHNCHGFGLFFWTNEVDGHFTQNFKIYRCASAGIGAGAYQNGLQWDSGLLLECGINHNQSSKLNANDEDPFYRNIIVEALTGVALGIGHRNVEGHEGVYLHIDDCSLSTADGSVRVRIADGANPWFAHFLRCTRSVGGAPLTPADFEFDTVEVGSGNDGSHIIIEDAEGAGWNLNVTGGALVVTEL